MITPKEAIVFDELTKFPELKSVLVDLLTPDYDKFVSSIDWVAPRPTTFRINLKNEQEFYLMYGKRSWIAQVEGRKYYLKSLPEEEKAALAISRLLRYGIKDEEEVDGDMEGDDFDAPTETPPTETPAEESPTED
jgi:hypothetical protein